jgi:hypothetical protein
LATRVFADQELEALRKFPEIGREELIRFFMLTPADLAFIDPGRGRGPADRLGLAVILCTVPWLGFVPDEVAAAPRAAVVRLAEQLQVDPDALRSYGRRAKTGLALHHKHTTAELTVAAERDRAVEAGTNAAGPRTVRVVLDAADLRIEVEDGSPDEPLTPGVSRFGAFRGRGLALVEALARWGIIRRAAGKTVWATLAVA